MMMEICYLETVELHVFSPKILTHVFTEKWGMSGNQRSLWNRDLFMFKALPAEWIKV